jgi:hypothetical protein
LLLVIAYQQVKHLFKLLFNSALWTFYSSKKATINLRHSLCCTHKVLHLLLFSLAGCGNWLGWIASLSGSCRTIFVKGLVTKGRCWQNDYPKRMISAQLL